MVSAILPLYLVVSLGFSPLQFGLVDGLYQGAKAAAHLLRGGSFQSLTITASVLGLEGVLQGAPSRATVADQGTNPPRIIHSG